MRKILAVTVAVALALSLGPAPVSGQAGGQQRPLSEESPRPVFWVDSYAAPELALTVCVPSPWSLYAPDLPDHPANGVGLPLRILAGERALSPTSWPSPESRATVLGRSWIHEAGCFGASVDLPEEAEAVTELGFRWALCRDDLCIPGRSVVAIPRADR